MAGDAGRGIAAAATATALSLGPSVVEFEASVVENGGAAWDWVGFVEDAWVGCWEASVLGGGTEWLEK